MHPEQQPNPSPSLEALEARLRALPAPPAPADLEARLLARIPAKKPAKPWRRAAWIGIVGALAAACLLAALVWPQHDRKEPQYQGEGNAGVLVAHPSGLAPSAA